MVKKVEQPEVNIGLFGHVDHGKTTLNERFSGKWTDTHSEEIKRGITIRLGYADAVFYKCKKSEKYQATDKCEDPKDKAVALRKVSFVDAPGHESLMATMLSGATIIDGALLLIAANEACPQPQTREHLVALQISGIKNLVVVQNKIDLVSKERALKNYNEIKEFLKDTDYKDAPVIPISAQHNVNIDMLIQAIEENIPTPKRDPKADPIMFIARSFDINKPGVAIDKIIGGVLGGSVQQGKLCVGDEIELRPGRMVEEKNRKIWVPIRTKIIDIKAGGKTLKCVDPGGSVGILTSLDPSVVKSDKLTGNIIGYPEKLPAIWYKLKLKTSLLERVVGAKEELKVEPIKKHEPLMLNCNSAATVGIVTELGKDSIECALKLPICAEPGSRVTVSRRIGTRFRLIGYGVIQG